MAEAMKKCALRSCEDRKIVEGSGRVEVKSIVRKFSSPSEQKIDWSQTGEAVFHMTCWKDIIKKNSGIQLSDKERTMVLEANKTAEYHDPVERTKQEAVRVTQLIRMSKYCIAFTGAGISTAAGIGDFRGKSGKWTERDRTKEYGSAAKPSNSRGKGYAGLRPTYTHEAIAKLVEMGHVKHVISQNCDGLHRLSGIPRDRLSELHGNVFHERCEDCGARYDRNRALGTLPSTAISYKKCPNCGHCHRTGNKCEREGCNGYLMKTVINFSDMLEKEVLGGAEEAAMKNDLVLCLGTTLMVYPASDLVTMGNPTRLIICNRQSTSYDKMCSQADKEGKPLGARFFGDCDDLMMEIMTNLLGPEAEKEWAEGREQRMQLYDQQRS